MNKNLLLISHWRLNGRLTKYFLSRRGIASLASITCVIVGLIQLTPVSADTNLLIPNSATTTSGTSWTGAYTAVDDGATKNDSDYMFTSTASGLAGDAVEYTIENLPNVLTASQVVVTVRAQIGVLEGTADTMNFTLQDGTTVLQTSTTATLTTSWVDYTFTYNGSLTQTQVNNLRVKVTRVAVNGGGNGATRDDELRVSNVTANVTYSPANQVGQASYRWFGNKDTDLSTYSGFSPKIDYAAGTGPNSIVTADFNGDSHPDLAVANNGSSTVSILSGTGAGTFGAKTDYTTGTGPNSVVTADFNGDGNADLATANGTANSVSVLIGTGAGTFGAKTDYTTGFDPRSVTSADFNGDGNADLAVAGYGDDVVSIHISNGDGTFSAGSYTDASTGGPIFVTSADFNGDGNADLATVNPTPNTVSIYLGTGTGNFGSPIDYSTGAGPYSITSADFNGDDNLDLAISNTTDNTVSILSGTGTGTFGAKTDYATGGFPYSITSADFNGDSHSDLAVANNGSVTVSILLGTGTGTFGAKTDFYSTLRPRSITAADLDGDGRHDLATANTAIGSNSVSVYLQSISPIDVDTPLAAQNTAATTPADGDPFRLRMNLAVSNGSATTGDYKLQYAQRGSDAVCDPSFTGETYQDVQQSIATATNLPTSAVNDTAYGSTAWSNPANALTEDNSRASLSAVNQPISSNHLRVTGFNFTIPAGAVVKGVSATINASQSTAGLIELRSHIVKNNTSQFTRTESAYPGISDSDFTVGSSTQLWGTTLTPSDINSPTFGIALSGFSDIQVNASLYVDAVQVTVHYESSGVTYYDNAIATSDIGVAPNANDPNDGRPLVRQTYHEDNPFGIATAIPAGEDGLWDFALTLGGDLEPGAYCFRAISNTGSVLDSYSQIPELLVESSIEQAGYKFFENNNENTSFVKTLSSIGVDTSDDDYLVDVLGLEDGGYAVLGQANVEQESGNRPYVPFIAEFNSENQLTDTIHIDNSFAYGSKPTAFAQTTDGGFIIVGNQEGMGVQNGFLLKISSTGEVLWSQDTGLSVYDEIFVPIEDVLATSDGGVVIASTLDSFLTTTEAMTAKYDSSGSLVWMKTYSDGTTTRGKSIAPTSDGGYVLAGDAVNDAFISKHDSSGNVVWTNKFGGADGPDTAEKVIQAPDGSLIVTGQTTGYNGGFATSGYVAKFSESGVSEWIRLTASGASSDARDVIARSDGYIVVGFTSSSNSAYITKLNVNGFHEWSTGYVDGDNDQFNGIIAIDERFVAVGSTQKNNNSDGLVAKFESDGTILGCQDSCPNLTLDNGFVTPVVTSVSMSMTNINPVSNAISHYISDLTFQVTFLVRSLGVSSPLAAINIPAIAPNSDTPLRLRINLGVSVAQLDVGDFKLQYAARGDDDTCDPSGVNEIYADVSESSAIKFYDNSEGQDGSGYINSSDDPLRSGITAVGQSYEENNPFNVERSIKAGQDSLWDFALAVDSSATQNSHYCLRAVNGDDSLLSSYSYIPELIVAGGGVSTSPALDQQLRGGQGVVDGVKTPFSW